MGIVYAALVVNPYHKHALKWYVGQTTKSLSVRRRYHETVLSSKAFMHAFELRASDLEWYILAEASTPVQLQNLEREWIQILETREPKGLNRTSGGDGTPGIERSPEWREKLRLANVGRRLTAEQKQKISLSLRGNKNHSGAHHSAETRAKMSAAWDYDKHMTPSTLAKIREAAKKHERTLDDHLQANTHIDPATGCLIWDGYVCNGQPAFEHKHQMHYVRRELAARSSGVSIGRIGNVRRTCPNSLCISIDHLRFKIAAE